MPKLSRRDLLIAGASAGAGAVASGAVAMVGGVISTEQALAAQATQLGRAAATATRDAQVSALGVHQAGVELELQTFTNFVAFDLAEGTDLAAFERWMRLLTEDIHRLATGEPVLADAQGELALGPARTTVTLGLGPSFFDKLGLAALRPAGFAQVPNLKIDKLRTEFSEGDLLLQVSADDPIVLSHAVRALIRDSLAFANVRWSQQGFSNAQGVTGSAATPGGVRQRNLMGQVDGTDNPELGSAQFAQTVWIDSESTDQPWLVGGTQLVLRRIAMNLDTWDKLGRSRKEEIIGRDLAKGAPLGQDNETDLPDFSARRADGLLQIPGFAHIRNAAAKTADEIFFRRPFNYEVGVSATGAPDVGLLWTAYARDLAKQYLPVQQRLAQVDLLNLWTTPIGSSTWLIVPGLADYESLLCGSLIAAARA